MNLQNLLIMAQKMGIDQNKIQQALQMSKNYSQDVNGLRKVINDNGGKNFLDKALTFANNPLVRVGLNKIGVTPEVIEGIKKDLGITETTNANYGNDILERLKKLK